MKFDTLLFDIDNTLLDFTLAEHISLEYAFERWGLEFTEERLKLYSKLNDDCWKRFERGELEKREIPLLRFEMLKQATGLSFNPEQLGKTYIEKLSDTAIYIDGARQLLDALFGKVRLFAVTNGIKAVQNKKLAISGLSRYFEGVFISEEIGFPKPSELYFSAVAHAIPDYSAKRTAIVGDSLTADMPAKNFGITSIWFNRFGENLTGTVTPDYEIKTLSEVLSILD